MDRVELRSETRKVHREIRWTIDDVRAREKESVPNEFLASPKFVVSSLINGVLKEYEFNMRIYLKADNGNSEHIGVFLEYSSPRLEDKLRVSFQFFILDEQGGHVATRKFRCDFIKGTIPTRGHPLFYSKSKFDSNEDKIINFGALTLGCDVDILISNDFVDEKFSNVEAKTGSILGKRLYSEMQSGSMTDITLACGEKRFKCHKVVLAAQSSVFKDMMKHSTDDHEEVDIKDMKPETLEKLLEYVYLEKVDLGESAEDLLQASDRFDLDGLKSICGRAMVSSLSTVNVAKVLSLLDVHGCDENLVREAAKLAARNLPEVIKTEQWANVVALHPRASSKVFEAVASLQGDKQNN